MTRSLVLIPRDGDRQFLTREQAEELLASVPDYVEPVVPVLGDSAGGRGIITDADRLIDLLISRGKPFPKSKNRMFGNKEYDLGLALSLEAALEHAGSDGFVPSMPLLIAGKSMDINNYLWGNWFNCLSEELVGVDKEGAKGVKDEPLVVVVHGSGVLTGSPDRIMKAYSDEFVDGWGKISNPEFAGVLNGELPNGRRLSGVYTVQDVIDGKVKNPLSSTYAVWLPLSTAKSIPSGCLEKSVFTNSHLVIARAGILDYLGGYFDKAGSFRGVGGTKTVGNYHNLAGLNADVLKLQPRGSIPFVEHSYSGIHGGINFSSVASFVGVALKKRGASQ